MSTKKFLFYLMVVAVLVRIPIILFYIDYPSIPHDMYAYREMARLLLGGGVLYQDENYEHLTMYGSLFAVVIAGWVKMFGYGYLGLKIPSLIFDVLTVIPVYLIIKEIKDERTARYGVVVFTFSYTVLANIMEGNDDHIFLFFMLMSIYYLIKNSIWSPVMLAVAAGFKVTPFIILPPILYYEYRNHGIRRVGRYMIILIILFSLIILPFYLKAGMNVFYPYLPNSMDFNVPVGTNIASVLGFLDYFFNYGLSYPYENYEFPSWILKPLTYGGVGLGLIYSFTRGSGTVGLIKSSFVMIFVGLMFSINFDPHYILWVFPFLVILFVDRVPSFNGMFLGWIGVLIMSYFYRWDIDYPYFVRGLLVVGMVLSFWGAKLVFPQKPSISWMTLGMSAQLQMHSYILMLLSPIIPILAVRKFAWGVFGFGNSVFMVIVLFWVLRDVLRCSESISEPM